MLNNGAKALDPLTPRPRLCSPWEREEQTNARKEDNGIGQDVPGVLSSGAAEPVLCLPSNATRRHRSHAGLLSRAREDSERAAVDKQVGGKMTKPGQQRQSQARPGEARQRLYKFPFTIIKKKGAEPVEQGEGAFRG